MLNVAQKKLLQSKGFKITRTRLAILDAFNAFHKPLNAELIIKKIGLRNADLVTVYRTLTSFEEKGILKRVDLRKDSAYFELVDSLGRHHHHMICRNCGQIEDFELCGVEKLVGKIVSKASKFNAIEEHSLELFGQCTSCAC